MELIVCTAHGTADVAIDVLDRDVSLRDVVAAVTGQAAPDTAQVDGRMVNASGNLASCGVVAGSVIDTVLSGGATHETAPAATLRQLTGPGAGRSVPLRLGHYRIGPGRRAQGTELAADVADVVAFELDVTLAGVEVAPPTTGGSAAGSSISAPRLDGVLVERPTQWRAGSVLAAGRLFRLDRQTENATRPTTSTQRPFAPPVPVAAGGASPEGFIVYNRPPGIVDRHRTIVEAVDIAAERAPGLWHRRGYSGQLLVDIGVETDARAGVDTGQASDATGGLSPVTLDLAADRVVAVTGPDGDREAFIRSMLIDVCTQYGPADLDVVVAAQHDLEAWDWAKWLPHIRWGTAVDVLTNELEMASFAGRVLARPTIVVVASDDLWATATSPLRSVVMSSMEHASVIVGTSAGNTAPASASSVVELDADRPGSATLMRLRSGATIADVFVPLVDTEVAAEAARHLTPLIDPDRVDAVRRESRPATLAEVVGAADAGQRWDTAQGSSGKAVEMTIGRVADVPIGVDFALDASVAISGSTIDEAIDLAAVLALSVAATWSPTEAALLVVDHRVGRRPEPLRLLPHHAGTFVDRDAPAIERLLSRLRDDVSGERPTERRLVVVVAGLAETELAAPGLIEGLISIATDSIGVHLVIATARPLAALAPALRAVCPVEIAVDRYGGNRRATLHDRRRTLRTPFVPYDERTDATQRVAVRPYVFGRRPSSLERRLERDRLSPIDSRDSAAVAVADRLRDLATERAIPAQRPLLPIPLPTRVIAAELWAGHPGDGVPLGTLDVADAETEVADWWYPGPNGSRLLLGSPRSGVRSALEVLLVGVVSRFAPADLQVLVIEHNARRRASMGTLPHVIHTASPDHDGDVDALLGGALATVAQRSDDDQFRLRDQPSVLVIVRDIERLTAPAVAALTELYADGAAVGVNVVATAARPHGISTVLAAAAYVAVGSLSDPDDYARLGVARSSTVERHVGRAQIVDAEHPAAQRSDQPDGTATLPEVRLVQLAELDGPFDDIVRALAATVHDERE